MVGMGTKVTVRVNGVKNTFEIVGEWEADMLKKKNSHTSPLGSALVGKKVGEKMDEIMRERDRGTKDVFPDPEAPMMATNCDPTRCPETSTHTHTSTNIHIHKNKSDRNCQSNL